MPASVDTWKSYAQLILRLCPSISRIVFAAADAAPLWSNDPASAALLHSTLASLSCRTVGAQRDIDGVMQRLENDACYGFRISP
ncbi:MAG TPA: hypothetical protein VMQ54_11695, partial [Steroidobacteraceae bacterium]|nr:hypothetical protein [Steroidobacteraceae bacterium]